MEEPAVHAVPSTGTVNTIFRLGSDLVLRLPRIPSGILQLDKERRWLGHLAPALPLAIPVPIAVGEPGEGFPWRWGVYPWLEGEDANIGVISDSVALARDLGGFLTALHSVDAADGPGPGEHNFFRGVPLAERAVAVREAVSAAAELVDLEAVSSVWEDALSAPPARVRVWIHGDVSPGNILLVKGRLAGVIDFGGLGVGDRACDLMVAWTLFRGESRRVFREAATADDATWSRARGWALSWALIALPYYLTTNAVIVRSALDTIREVLQDDADTEGR